MTTEIAANNTTDSNKQQQQHQQQHSDSKFNNGHNLDRNISTDADATTQQHLINAANSVSNITSVETLVPSLGKYPLENSWSFWFFKNDSKKDWKDNLVFITTVDFVEDFWAVYTHLQPVSKLSPGCDYMFFKKDIQPMWEDKENRDGGRWLLSIDKRPKQQQVDSLQIDKSRALLDSYWLNTLLALIGDQFYDESVCVNGAVVNIRPKADKIAIWTKLAKDNELQKRIGRKFNSILSLKEDILTFEAHGGSSK